MKATLTYNLDDPDDRLSHLRAVKSTELAVCLWEICHNTFRKVEGRIDCGELNSPYDVIERVKSDINNIVAANGIDIDNLIA
jgi:hypothetical protein